MTRLGALSLIVAVSVAVGCGSSSVDLETDLPVVVLESPDAPSWVRLIRAAGYSARMGDLDSLLRRSGGIVPADATLSDSERSRIAGWVGDGGRLATAHEELLDELDIARDSPVQVRAVTMRRLSGTAEWASPLTLMPIAGGEPLATSAPGGSAVVATEEHGSGVVVAFAVDPIGGGRHGWELLPGAPALVGSELRAPVGPKSQGAEIFVDPGALPEDVKDDPDRIASLLARAGARVAQVAAWHYDFNDPADDYDYDSLIDALHARGILAYAWLEPPLVTLRMWQDHPSCREKTETGRDAFVDWRSLIALEDPACFELAKASWRRVLTRHRWDGVNVAELYFEPPFFARNHTPFSAAALERFGHDPRADPQGFADFRVELVTELNRQVLDFVGSLPNAARLGLQLTVIDDTLDPETGRAVGSDIRALAAVARRAGAALVVEDPYTTWTEGPLRYERLGRHVSSLMPPGAALLDVNVFPRPGAKPTSQMKGAELALAFSAATSALGKLAIYSLGTMTQEELARIPGSMAGSTATTDLGVFGRWTVKVSAPSPRHRRLRIDGIQWPVGRGTALVPPGNHVLEWSEEEPVGPGLTAFTGQIGTASVSGTSLTFTYDTRPDGLAVVTRRPSTLEIDGSPAPLDVIDNPDGGFVVRVPSGTHRAVLGF